MKVAPPFSWNVSYRSILLLLVLFFGTLYIKPYMRGFNCADKSIQNPYRPLQVPTRWLFFFTLFVPSLFICLVLHYSMKCQYNVTKSQLVKFIFGFMVNLTLTELAKKTFGRLRPHTYTFCNLGDLCPSGPVNQYIESFTCNNPDASWVFLVNTRLSFYSGHSSLGSFAGTYLTLFIHKAFFARFRQLTAIQKALVILLELSIFTVYLYPGYTQWKNFWHFYSDVLTGYSFGIFYALLVFSTVNGPVPVPRHSP